MKAVILAAGMARRMQPLSCERHKTLLEVDGRSIMSRIIDGLVVNGIREVCIVTGYRAGEVESFVTGEFPHVRFSFIRNTDFETTNNIYSMALALEQFECDEDIVLIESDLIFDPGVLTRLLNSPHPNVALVDRYRIGMDGTVVAISSSGVITQVIPPALQDDRFDFSDKYKTLNMYKFSAEFCRTTFRKLLTYYARTIDHNCYYELILGILIYMQQVEIQAEVLEGESWTEVDDPNDLRGAEFMFAVSKRRSQLEESWGGYWTMPVTDFAFIRNVYFPTSAMMSEMKTSLPQLVVNYGSAQSVLDGKLGYFLLCNPENVRALNGASQLFPFLKRRFRDSDVLLPTPTFGEYSRAFPHARKYRDSVGFDIAEVESAAPERGLVVIVNPNNPTGSTVPTEAIVSFARSRPTSTVLVDESFIEFSGQTSIIPHIEAGGLENVIVLKSLSKSLGVPGIRLGFVYSAWAGLIDEISADLPVWNVNSLAEYFLEILLKHRRELEESLNRTIDDRERFAAELADVPFIETVYPSGANFVLIRTSLNLEASRTLVNKLLESELVYVKDVSSKLDDGRTYWRLAVRSAADNAMLCRLLRDNDPREATPRADSILMSRTSGSPRVAGGRRGWSRTTEDVDDGTLGAVSAG
jgi:histidinol-phosphate/aromatic aminotransferase/cobyric acid decarboxylase-like protein/choline kinase